MANRNIAFTIKLNGVDQVFSSISELENAIRTATEELKNFTGTEADFKKLQEEIKGANNELNKIREGTKGLSTEKQIGQYLKLGQVITGAFGAASTALSLFGQENEGVAEAAAKAQQILTLQYSLVTLAKEKDTIATVGNTIATIANTAATQGLRAAMTLLFATMRANPFGALLTVIGLVAGAFLLLTNRTKDQDNAEKNYQKTLERTRTLQQNNLKLLESSGAGAVTIARERLKIAQREEQLAEKSFADALRANRFSEEAEKARTELDTKRVERMIAENNLDKAIKEEQEKREDDLNETREKNERNRLERLQKLREEFRRTIQGEIDLYRSLKVELSDLPEPNFLSKLRQGLEDTERAIVDFVGGPTVDELLENLFGDRKELDASIERFKDFQIEFKNFRRALGRPATGLSGEGELIGPEALDQLREAKNEFLDIQSIRLQQGKIGLTEFNLYKDLAELYEGVGKTINDIPSLAEVINAKDEEGRSYFDVLRNVLIGNGILKQDVTETGELVDAYATQSLSDAQENLSILEADLAAFLQTGIKQSEEYKRIVKEQGIAANTKEENKLIEELVKERILAIRRLVTEEVQTKNQIFDLYEESLENSIKRRAQSTSETIVLLGTNLNKFFKENENNFDVTSIEFAEFFDNYVRGLVDFSKLTEKELELLTELYRRFGIKVNDALQGRTKPGEKTALEKFADNSIKQIQKVQVALQAIQQAVSDYYQFQFDQLEKRNKRVNDSIVGDSKRAQELRLEQEKIYNAERERLEKKSAKTQLQLTLAQTIANVAQAVAQNLANPILATIVGAAGAVQIGIVTRQIQTLDAYNRGGMLKKKGKGGRVVGPPHEEGGVKFQQGGVELEGNEAIINRVSTLRYADILSSINIAGGGNPIVMSNFDDSRIVEAIAKQRQTPIRAFVVESDITNAQTINKRLELLSQI